MELYHSIIGLPHSGKTTFLAALWHLIEANEISTSLVLDHLEGEKRYLNQISTAWRECEKVPRTPISSDISVGMHAKLVNTGQQLVLSFPDLSGESFEQIFSLRKAKKSYIEGFNRKGGILLFISANRSTDGLTIADLGPEILEAEGGDQKEELASTNELLTNWKPEMVPQQAKLVDLLQMLQQAPFEIRQRRLAVILSAWDVVLDTSITPTEWLTREMPLISQFLNHNPDSFDFRVWGVSAQGGDISGDARTSLLAKTPSERVHCVGPTGMSSDLTAPISWLCEAV